MLAREVARGALAQPGPAEVAAEAARAEGRWEVRVVAAEHDVRVLVQWREPQRLPRARHGGGAAPQRFRGEHVHLAGREPTAEVAATGGCAGELRQRQPGLRQRELREVRVEDHRDVFRNLLEPLLEPRAEALERLEHRARPVRGARVVPRGEGAGLRLDPGHVVTCPSTLASHSKPAGTRLRPGSTYASYRCITRHGSRGLTAPFGLKVTAKRATRRPAPRPARCPRSPRTRARTHRPRARGCPRRAAPAGARPTSGSRRTRRAP